jgi:fatty-acyl-CoA synthase/long-chain acyl-CoA synthetase
MNIGEGLTLNAVNHPRKTALIYQGRRKTYAEMNQAANRLANAVWGMGLRKGDKAALLLYNCPEYMEAIFGLAKIGVVLVPINYRLAAPEIEYIINNSDSRLLITEAACLGQVLPILPRLEQVRPDRCILLGEGESAGMARWGEVLARSSDREPEVEVEETDTFYIGYTSGTTGFPKGAVFSHKSRVMRTLLYSIIYGIPEEDVQLVVAPIYHAAPFAFALMEIYRGGTLVIQRDFDPAAVLHTIQEERVSSAFFVPTMYHEMVNLPPAEAARYDLSSLRILITGGAPLSARAKEQILAFFTSAGLFEFYGGTETGMVTILQPKDQLSRPKSVGQPIFGTRIRLLDEQGQEVPLGEVGELYMKGPTTFDCYYKDPQATAEVLREGWLTIGDMARRDEDGYYYIVDRKRDMIVSGGANIYPAEVEKVLSAHPKVRDVAVLGVPDEKWGEAVKAVVVLREGQKATAEELQEYCRGELASYKIPSSVDFVAELPRTPSGKVLKRQLRDAYWEGRERKV